MLIKVFNSFYQLYYQELLTVWPTKLDKIGLVLDESEVQFKSICKTHFRKITEFPFNVWVALYIFILLSTVDDRNIFRIRFQDFKTKADFDHAVWAGSLVKHFNTKFISQLYSAEIICPVGIWSSPHNLDT